MIDVEPTHTFKFIVIGSIDCGKTSLPKRLIDDDFAAETSPTVSIAYLSASVKIDGRPIKLQLWDTASQELFRSIAKSDSLMQSVLFLYSRSTTSVCGSMTFTNSALTLVGNKLDLSDGCIVTSAEAQVFADNHQLSYLEASARSGDNAAEGFHRATRAVYERAEAGILLSKTAIGPQAG
jgi:small GTP-binding protein